MAFGSDGVGIDAMPISKRMFGAREIVVMVAGSHVNIVQKCGADIIVEDNGKHLCYWADVALDEGYETILIALVFKDIGRSTLTMPSRHCVI